MFAINIVAQEVSEKGDVYPKGSELVVGAIAFGVFFFFLWRWVVPRFNAVLSERRADSAPGRRRTGRVPQAARERAR